MRRTHAALVPLLVALVLPAAADAAALAYRDATGNVLVARPDGSGAKVVRGGSDNGVTSTLPTYSPPAVDQQGGIFFSTRQTDANGNTSVFVSLYDQDGGLLHTAAGPWLFPMPFCGSIAPFRTAIQATGAFAAALYNHGTSTCTGGGLDFRTRIVDKDGPSGSDANSPVYGQHAGLLEPRFIKHGREVLAGRRGDTIEVWKSPEDPTLMPWVGLNGPASSQFDIDSFDVHPTLKRMIMEQSPEGLGDSAGEGRDYLVIEYTGNPGDPAAPGPTELCSTDGLITKTTTPTRPRYSWDGTQIAWTGADGIYTSPAPTAGAGCGLVPKLVIPGGRDVDWAPFDIPVPAPAPTPTPGTSPTPGTGGSTGGSAGGTSGGPSGGGTTTPTKLSVATVAKRSRAAFRSGLSVDVQAPAAGTVKVVATVSKATARATGIDRKAKRAVTVASVSRRVTAAGKVTLKLKPTAKAKARAAKLAGVTLTLKVTLGGRTATRTVKLTK